MYIEEQYILEIGHALADEHAAVMVGAGFSKNAEKISTNGREFLNWNQLSDLFYKKLYGDSEYPGKNYCSSLRLAEEVEIMTGRPGLEKILKQAIPDEDYVPSELHKKMMELPWCDVFTTNYDTLLERAADLITSRRYNVVVCKEDLVNSSNTPRIVKLHGSFPSQRPFIITEEDYRTYPVKFAPMVNTVQQALLENVFCMLGFSCEDPNFISWIGWIHDHLSKSSSQKIYMVTVTHVSEAQKKLYFEKNIIVVDLEKLWPEKSVLERLEAFLLKLKVCVDEKSTQLNWFDFRKEYQGTETSLGQKIEQMRRLRLNYPGWIFLPWNLKKKTHCMIEQFNRIGGIDKISYNEQLDYMYEYVKFLDIAGRPILVQFADDFWKILKPDESVQIDELRKSNKDIQNKEQTIYLHLLRTYRELGNWEKVEECRKNINIELLNYEERQFLYAEECRFKLFRFEAKELAERLEKWNISQGDVYWPIIKAYLHAAIGENKKARDVLIKNLASVRKQLMRDEKNVYLASVEESCVSLVNFIRQAENIGIEDGRNFEKCIHAGSVSWGDENNKYAWSLKAEQNMRPQAEIKYRYDLGKTYTTRYGNDNEDIYTAMEYWRFLEKTGHTFRIGNVMCKEGLEGSVKRLCRYYPYWCLMQILISQKKECIDYLFGRADMALLTRAEADEQTKEFLLLLKTVMEQLKGEDFWTPKSVYEQAAKVLPEILARYTYKCSVEILDEMLDLLLRLCLSNKYIKFKGLGPLLKGVVEGYTPEQQKERIDKILSFPVASNHISEYEDPVNYIYRPKIKYKIALDLYYRVLAQLRQENKSEDANVRRDALNRLTILEQIIELEENDKKYLIELMENENDAYSAYMLYKMKEKDTAYLEQIMERTCNVMKDDSNIACFTGRGGREYAEMLWIIDDIDFVKYNTAEWMEVLENLIRAMQHWKQNEFSAEERIRQSCIIVQRILISMQEQENYHMSDVEEKAYAKLKETVEENYGNAVFLEMAALGIHKENVFDVREFEKALWMCGKESIDLMRNLLKRLSCSSMKKSEDSVIIQQITKMCEIFSMRLLHAEPEIEEALLIFFQKAAEMNLLTSTTVDFICLKLEYLLEETVIKNKDNEETAINKINNRIEACALASELYQKKECRDIVLKWKAVSESKDEFIEIRRIIF